MCHTCVEAPAFNILCIPYLIKCFHYFGSYLYICFMLLLLQLMSHIFWICILFLCQYDISVLVRLCVFVPVVLGWPTSPLWWVFLSVGTCLCLLLMGEGRDPLSSFCLVGCAICIVSVLALKSYLSPAAAECSCSIWLTLPSTITHHHWRGSLR